MKKARKMRARQISVLFDFSGFKSTHEIFLAVGGILPLYFVFCKGSHRVNRIYLYACQSVYINFHISHEISKVFMLYDFIQQTDLSPKVSFVSILSLPLLFLILYQ